MAFSAGCAGGHELNLYLPVKCCPYNFGIASNPRFKLFLDTINSRVGTGLIAVKTADLLLIWLSLESPTLFFSHVMTRAPHALVPCLSKL